MLKLTDAIRASQEILKELELACVQERLIATFIEHTGAQKAALLLQRQGRWVVDAEGAADTDLISTLQATPLESCSHFTSLGNIGNIIERVAHSQEKIIIDLAEEALPVKERKHGDHQPVVTLFLPLWTTNRLQGILGLTGNFKADHFSQERWEALDLLAAQTAIALNNAARYGALKQETVAGQRVEQALQNSEDRYQRLIELSFEAIVIHVDEKIVYINPSGLHLYRVDQPEYLIGKSIYNFIHPDYWEAVRRRLQKLRAKRGVALVEEKLVRPDGTVFDAEVAAVPITYQDRPAVQFVIRNISVRKQEEEQLKTNELKFRTLAETTSAAVFIFQGSKNVYVNPKAVALTGYSQTELLSMNFWEVIHPDFVEVVKARGQSRQKGEMITSHYELKLLRKDGSVCWVESTLRRIEFDGAPAVLGTAFDITERKKAEADREELLAAERSQRQLAETLRQEVQQELLERRQAEERALEVNQKLLALQHAGATVAFSLDIQYILDTVSLELSNLLEASGCTIIRRDYQAKTFSVLTIYGLPSCKPEQSLAQSLDECPLAEKVLVSRRAEQITIDQDDLASTTRICLEKIGAKTLLLLPMEFHDRVSGLAGVVDQHSIRRFSYEDVALAQYLANQAASAIENARLYDQAQQEIEVRKRAEEALKESEENLRAIFDNSQQAFMLIDRNYKIRALNRTARTGMKLFTGREAKEGDLVLDFVPEADFEKTRRYFRQVLEEGRSVRVQQQVELRERAFWFEFHYDPVVAKDHQVIGICFSTVDITERKLAADAIVASEARLWTEIHTILATTRALVSRLNSDELLEFIVNQAKNLVEADGAVVLLLSEDGEQLELTNADKLRLSNRVSSQFLSEGSLIHRALATQTVQESTATAGVNGAVSVHTLLQLPASYSLLCAPLVIHGKNLGVLLIWRENKPSFAGRELRMLDAFASQAAIGLDNARLYTHNRQLAIEKERHRLARSLHDSVTQSLYSIGLAAQAALRLLQQNGAHKTREPIEHIHLLAKRALSELREHLYHLHPTVLQKQDLVEALNRHCRQLSTLYALDIVFESNLQAVLSISQQDGLYYIAREALWNIVKHADATKVNLMLTEEDNRVILSIADNGIGFDPAAFAQEETMGLRSIQERAKLLGGTMEPQSQPGKGTQLVVQVPIESR